MLKLLPMKYKLVYQDTIIVRRYEGNDHTAYFYLFVFAERGLFQMISLILQGNMPYAGSVASDAHSDLRATLSN